MFHIESAGADNRGNAMRAPISVVIPILNAQSSLPGCLAALMEGVEAGLIRELIVSDGGSTDAGPALAEASGAVLVTGAASRGGQLRRGCAAAAGDWLLVLHADSWLDAGWSDPVRAHLPGGQAGYFRLRFRARGAMPRLVAGWANLRARLFGLPYGDQGLLIPRALYDRAGGFADQPLMEDVAMARALRGQLARIDARIATGAERYLRDGWLRRGARNLGTLLRYLLGADPKTLLRRYNGRS